MRRLLSASIALLLAASLHAQQYTPTHTGGWIIGGSAALGHSHIDNGDFDQTFFTAAPMALTFVTPHLALGGTVELGYSSFDQGHDWVYGIGPSARYYFNSDPSPWLPFVSLTVEPQWRRSTNNILIVSSTGQSQSLNESTITQHVMTVDGSFGLTRLVATHVGVTGEAYYRHQSLHGDVPNGLPSRDQTSYDYGLRFGLAVFVK